MIRRLQMLGFVFAILEVWNSPGRADLPPELSDAVAWYDTLGYPDAKDLPYVRVATGLWSQSGSQPPANRFLEGFLVGKEADAFTVFICNVPEFKDAFGFDEPYSPLTTVRFVRKTSGPAYGHIDYEVLDFKRASSEAVDRVSAAGVKATGFGWPAFHRARIFAFGRACLEKGLPEAASALMDFAAKIRDPQNGKKFPLTFRDELQRQIGDAILQKAEEDVANPLVSRAELLKAYENFDARFPASKKIAYAKESADLLKKMIAEEKAHHVKPLDQMSPAEQAAENIYQLRSLGNGYWFTWINGRYPVAARTRDDKEVITPVHRLVDLDYRAVPQLIEALDDRRFTRAMVPRFNGAFPAVAMRVCDAAQVILEHISGRNLYSRRADNGKIVGATTRQLAEAWWAEVRSKGEKETLIEAAVAGGGDGLAAARKLVEKYPEAAIGAIEAGIRATKEKGYRGEYVEVAGLLPGDAPVAFLKSKLGPGNGLYSQVYAAEALSAHGQADAIPAMIEAWRAVQPRLLTNERDAYDEVGGLIAFLARSGDARAIEALGHDLRQAPVDVRLAAVDVFLPWQKQGSGSSVGKGVNTGPIKDHPTPAGEAGAAIERLLISALDDTERRYEMERDFSDFSCVDPRVCDMAAYTLSVLWPVKYQFRWAFTSTKCDAQIVGLRNRWRRDHGLPALPPPAETIIPAAKTSDLDPMLDKFASARDAAGRDAVTAQIAETFGFGALPAVRARFEESKNAAFRELAVNLASRVREVRIEADAGGSAKKSGIASLQGQPLDGVRIATLAQSLESALPPGVRSVTFFAEREGDGMGFKVTVVWQSGEAKKQNGWDRQMAVRHGNQRLYDGNGYTSEGGMPKDKIYRGMGDAFEKAIQSEIDAPVIARCRIERSP